MVLGVLINTPFSNNLERKTLHSLLLQTMAVLWFLYEHLWIPFDNEWVRFLNIERKKRRVSTFKSVSQFYPKTSNSIVQVLSVNINKAHSLTSIFFFLFCFSTSLLPGSFTSPLSPFVLISPTSLSKPTICSS